MKQFQRILKLSIAIAKAEIKAKNEGSYLGIFWYLLNPVLTLLLLWAIFFPRLGQHIHHYPLYLLLGIILFNFFQQATTEATRIIRRNARLVKSINFPLESLVGAVILKTLFSHLFEIILFIIVALFLNVPIAGILFYPLILILFCLFCLGACFLLSSLTIYLIDLENIWGFIVRLIWFATPIFYAIEGQTRLFFINLFNPMYYFITITRDILIYSRPPHGWMIAAAICYSVLFVLIGSRVFHKLKIRFSEMI